MKFQNLIEIMILIVIMKYNKLRFHLKMKKIIKATFEKNELMINLKNYMKKF